MLTSKVCYYLFGINPLIISVIILSWIFFDRKIEKLFNNKFFRIFFISLPVVIIFIRILRNGPFFLSDDFAHLELAYNSSYLGILKIVLSKPGLWVGHHMILGFWLFKFIYGMFGANIYPYVTVIFLLNLTSVILLYIVSGEFIKNDFVRTFTSFVFGFLYLSWISNIHELLGAIFLMSSFYIFIKWIKNKYAVFGIWSIILYVLAVFSKEITFLLFPIIVLVYMYKQKGRFLKRDLKILIPFCLTFIGYSIFYASTFFGYFGLKSGYRMGFDLNTIFNNILFYFKFILSGIGPYLNPTLILLFLLYIYTLYKKNYWTIMSFLGFFALIFPVLLFSNRVSTYYVYIPAIFLFLSFGCIGDFIFHELSRIKIKVFSRRIFVAIIIVLTMLYMFSTNKGLMDNCFLILAPWPNQSRQQFLNLTNEVKNFENGNQESAKFSLDEYSRGIIVENGVDVIRPFLNNRKDILYTYAYDCVNDVLIVNKE